MRPGKPVVIMKKIALILFLGLQLASFGQEDSLLRIKIETLKGYFTDFNYRPFEFSDTALTLIRDISKLEDLGLFPDRSIYLEKRAEQLRNDLGLDFVGSYLENFNLDPVQDLEENISYQRRVQMGMRWDLFSDGLLEHRMQAQMLENRLIREKLSNDIAKESQYYLKRFDQTIFAFNAVKLKMLEKRKIELEKQHGLIRDLVYLKKLNKEQLIRIEIRLSEVESLINVYKSYNDYLGIQEDSLLFTSSDLPLIDLDYDAIFKKVGIQTDSLLAGNNYANYFKWYHEIGVQTFMRYNYYDILASSDRSYFSAGINLTVPLRFDTQLNNEVEQEKWKYENERFTRDRAQLHEDVLNTAYDFRYQMKRFVELFQKRKLTNERLRIEKAKMRLREDSVDLFQGLELYDELLVSDIELVDVIQELYLKALKIHTKIPGTSIDEIIKSQSASDLFEYVSVKKRDVYIWSKTFDNNKGDFLAEYALYNEFTKLIVAVSDSDTSLQKKLFMQYASENSDVYYMLGENRLFYNKDITGYLGRVVKNYPGVVPNGIHIDIEPHAFPNWETDRRDLLNKYVVLITEISRFCKQNDLKLEISVPKHYDDFIMEQLFGLVDRVYLMCYENVDTDFLIRKIGPIVEAYPDQVVIALRTEDFETRLDMEDKIDVLQEKLNVREFAYHDLQRIINFDKRERY
jgi:hypothetical protein